VREPGLHGVRAVAWRRKLRNVRRRLGRPARLRGALAGTRRARLAAGRRDNPASMRIALAQLGRDRRRHSGNEARIRELLADARGGRAARALPELSITGYRPRISCSKEHFSPTRARRWTGSPRSPSWRWSACRSAPRTSTTPRACPHVAVHASIARWRLPNYGVSTRCATSRPARTARSSRSDGVKVGLTICEDISSAEPARGTRPSVTIGGRRQTDRPHLGVRHRAGLRAVLADREADLHAVDLDDRALPGLKLATRRIP